MTHFVIKAAGELVKECSDLNGKLAFGKVIYYGIFSLFRMIRLILAVWSILMAVKI